MAKHIMVSLEQKARRIVFRIKKVQSAVSDLFFFVSNSMRHSKVLELDSGPTPENGPESELSANVRDLVRTQCLIVLMLMRSHVF
jgi:hypothetical protein